jgi:RNA polymerase sigma factor (sigma-70 family)
MCRALPPPAGLSDSHLLERFLANQDEAAFAALVQSHGRMVMGVCHRVLGNLHDADDVFQAVFFFLARRAHSVIRREALGSWLYTVAYRAALQARSMRDRRRKREVQMADLPEPKMRVDESRDWQPLLDRELSRLPKKYRSVIVLCDLEGRPRKDVARHLGLKEGTLSSRLATARRMLATRLSKYGLTLSGGALAASIAHSTVSANVPISLVWTTAKAATLVAAGQYVGVSVSAVGLMKGAMKTMFLAKLKTVIGTSLVALALGVGGLIYNAEMTPGGAQAADEAKPKSELETLRKENELLKMNLRVTLEKIIAQEEELKKLKGPAAAKEERLRIDGKFFDGLRLENAKLLDPNDGAGNASKVNAVLSENALQAVGQKNQLDKSKFDSTAEALLKAAQDHKDKGSREEAIKQLEELIKWLNAGEPKPKGPTEGARAK